MGGIARSLVINKVAKFNKKYIVKMEQEGNVLRNLRPTMNEMLMGKFFNHPSTESKMTCPKVLVRGESFRQP